MNGRSFAGIFAGVVLGSFVQVFFFWGDPPERSVRFPVAGAMFGGLLVGVITSIVGACKFSRWFSFIAIGTLTGIIIGILSGAFVFAPLATTPGGIMTISGHPEASKRWDPTAEDRVRDVFFTLSIHSEEDYQRLSKADRAIVDVLCFVAEVDNGGLDQYFYNSLSDHTRENVESFEAIGSTETLEVLRQACSLFPSGMPSRDRPERQKQLEEIRERHVEKIRGRHRDIIAFRPSLDDELGAFEVFDNLFSYRKEDLYLLVINYWESSQRD